MARAETLRVDEIFVVQLAGRRWSLPHLPFRLIKTIQPALFMAYEEAKNSPSAVLGEAQIDRLAVAAWQAISYVEPSFTFDGFLELSFSVADLLAAIPAVAQAAGFRVQTAPQPY